jgi:hypothetical protein
MLQTLVYAAACIGPFGLLVWSMFNERALSEIERKKKRDALDQYLKR